jgi:hypothetical protein
MVWIMLWILSLLGFLLRFLASVLAWDFLIGTFRKRGADKALLTGTAKALTRLMPDSHNVMCETRPSDILTLDGN